MGAKLCVNGVLRVVCLLEPFDFVSLSEEAFQEAAHALDACLRKLVTLAERNGSILSTSSVQEGLWHSKKPSLAVLVMT